MTAPMRRLRECVEAWPGCYEGSYDPRCCRFPKSCSATIYDEGTVADEDLEPAAPIGSQPAEPVGASLRDHLLSMWQEYATSSDVVDDAHLVRWVNALIENLAYASRRLKRVEAPEPGQGAPSLPQPDDRDEEIRNLSAECAGLLRVLNLVRHAVYDYLPGSDAGKLILSLVNGPADETTPHVLRLPAVTSEILDGVLVGRDGDRYRWLPGGVWEAVEPRPGWRGTLGHVLDREGGSVTVEMPSGAA